jgi:hypothetical protein
MCVKVDEVNGESFLVDKMILLGACTIYLFFWCGTEGEFGGKLASWTCPRVLPRIQ